MKFHSSFVIRCSLLTSLCLLVAFSALAAPGCGKPSDLVSVRGQVTNAGQPLENAAITFYPQSGRPVTTPVSQGEYQVELPPGEYTVTVNVSAEIPPNYKEGDPIPPPKVVLPPEYTTRARSKLAATVTDGRSQTIDFPLE